MSIETAMLTSCNDQISGDAINLSTGRVIMSLYTSRGWMPTILKIKCHLAPLYDPFDPWNIKNPSAFVSFEFITMLIRISSLFEYLTQYN